MADEAPQIKKDVVPSEYRERYKATGGHAGDFIGAALQKVGADGLPALQTVMKENNIPEKKWATHNLGMQRMNLGNVLRSRFLNGEDIYILGKQYNVTHMLTDYNGEIDKDKPATIRKFAEVNEIQTSERTIKALTKTFFGGAEKAKREKDAADKKTAAAAAKVKKAADKEAAATKKAAEKTAAAEKKAADKATAAAAKKAAKPAKPAKKAEPVKEPA